MTRRSPRAVVAWRGSAEFGLTRTAAHGTNQTLGGREAGAHTMFTRQDPASLVDLLGALYDVEQTRALWFRGVLKAAATAFDCGAGVGMMLYDVSEEVPRLD